MLYETLGKRLGKRFIHHLNPGATVPVNLAPPTINLDPVACLRLLEEPQADASLETNQLRQSLESVAQTYREHSKQRLSAEQMALAVVMLAIRQLADTLHNGKQSPKPSVLRVNNHSSCMAVTLLAEALNTETIRLSRQHSAYPASAQCLHTLRRPLSELSIQDLEKDGRQLRQRCERQFPEHGQDSDCLHSSWCLHLRYAGNDNTLKLKCMPLDMLLEQFEREYRLQFGAPPDSNAVIVEALELSVNRKLKCTDKEPHPLMNPLKSRWQHISSSKERGWDGNVKQPRLHELHPWLTDPHLNDILLPHLKPDYFPNKSDFLWKTDA